MSGGDETIACPACKSRNRRKAFRCRECGETLPAGKIDHEQIRLRQFSNHPSHIEPDESFAPENSLTTVFLLFVMALAEWGIFRMFPGVGIFLAILTSPMVIRLARNIARGPPSEASLLNGICETIGSLFMGLSGAVMVFILVVITFFVICVSSLQLNTAHW